MSVSEQDQIRMLEETVRELRRAREDDLRQLHAMTLLNETTADLAAVLEIDVLLPAICARARALLGTDVAYVMLNDDEHGSAYVRATAGVVSKAFREMRLDFDVGLGGYVAERAISAATSDYVRDERFTHSAMVDRLVQDEGLHAIVGVPLLRRASVLGVLLSASRTIREFSPSDVALLETLATHVTIAIENARLFDEVRSKDGHEHRRAALISALLEEPDPDPALIAREAARLELRLDSPHVVLVVDGVGQQDRWAARAMRREAALEHGAAGEVEGRIAVLVPGEDVATVIDRWRSRLNAGDGSPREVAVSEPASGIAGIRAAFDEARNALVLRRALGARTGIAPAQDLGLFALVFGHGPPDALDAFVERHLGPIVEYDAARAEPTLLPTLDVFFEEGGRLSRTAAKLHIHINTLYQRLARVDELLGSGWRTSDGSLELQFAIRARRLAMALRPHQGGAPAGAPPA